MLKYRHRVSIHLLHPFSGSWPCITALSVLTHMQSPIPIHSSSQESSSSVPSRNATTQFSFPVTVGPVMWSEMAWGTFADFTVTSGMLWSQGLFLNFSHLAFSTASPLKWAGGWANDEFCCFGTNYTLGIFVLGGGAWCFLSVWQKISKLQKYAFDYSMAVATKQGKLSVFILIVAGQKSFCHFLLHSFYEIWIEIHLKDLVMLIYQQSNGKLIWSSPGCNLKVAAWFGAKETLSPSLTLFTSCMSPYYAYFILLI